MSFKSFSDSDYSRRKVPVEFLAAVMNGIGQDRLDLWVDSTVDYEGPTFKVVEYYEKQEDNTQVEHEHGSDTAMEE